MNGVTQRYSYEGPVMLFDKCIALKWKGQTYAISKKKAKSNMVYQFNLEHKYTPSTKITLPSAVKEVLI